MSARYNYRPRFVDIRVVKPAESEARPRGAEIRCEHGDCRRRGDCRAPKDRMLREYWHFCAEHARDYNRDWDYFSGMSEAEFERFRAYTATGERPTWPFRANPNAGTRSRARVDPEDPRAGFADPHRIFRGRERKRRDFSGGDAQPEGRRFGGLQIQCFEILGLEPGTGPAEIRARYGELVKRLHPDSNGGDRTTEAHLGKVIRAYKTLRAGGLA
jgi:hypothetical protein